MSVKKMSKNANGPKKLKKYYKKNPKKKFALLNA